MSAHMSTGRVCRYQTCLQINSLVGLDVQNRPQRDVVVTQGVGGHENYSTLEDFLIDQTALEME